MKLRFVFNGFLSMFVRVNLPMDIEHYRNYCLSKPLNRN